MSGTPGRTERVLAGWLWLSTGGAVQASVTILILAVLARLLTPADFGVASAALLASEFARVLPEGVVGAAVIQRPVLRPAHVRTAVAIALLTAAVVAALLWVLAPAIAGFLGISDLVPVLRALAVAQPLTGIAIVPEALLRRGLRFPTVARCRAASFAIGYGMAGTGLAVAGARHWALVGAAVAQALVMAFLVLRAQRGPLRPGFEASAARELMSFSGGFLLARIGNYAAGNGDSLVVARWLGAPALGVYDRAYRLMAAPAMLLGQALDEVLFPMVSQVQSDRSVVANAYRRAVGAVALVMLPASLVLWVLAPEIVAVLLGPGWHAVVAPFRILSLALLFRTSYKISDAFARALGAVYRRAWRQWVFAVMVTGGAMAGQRWGTEGVAWAVVGALGANFALQAHLILHLVGLRWRSFAGAHAPALRVAVLAGGAAAGAAGVLRAVPALPAAATLALTLAATAAALWMAGAVLGSRLLGAEGDWLVGRVVQLRRRYWPVPLAGGAG